MAMEEHGVMAKLHQRILLKNLSIMGNCIGLPGDLERAVVDLVGGG